MFWSGGLCAFRAFLLFEHSEEYTAFYLAYEDYKNTKTMGAENAVASDTRIKEKTGFDFM